MDVRIEHFPAREIACIRHTGAYTEIGPTMERLVNWAVTQQLPLNERPPFTMSYDDPTEVSTDALRSDACIEVREDVTCTGDIALQSLPARRYAVYTYQGPYDAMGEAYQQLFGQWLPASGEEIADAPCIERYLNDCTTLPPGEWLTDLCIPLQD